MRNEELLRATWVCQDCARCTGVCPVARTGLGFSPRRLIRRAMDTDLDSLLANRALFACLACDRCAAVCKSGISISTAVLALRELALERGFRFEPAHDGMLQSLMRLQANSDRPQDRLGWLDDTVRVAVSGDTVYFVGCAPFFEPLFEHLGVRPLETARNAVRLLNAVGIEPVLLPDERCCGHDLLWQGDTAGFRRLAERNIEQLSAAGAETVVFACPEGLRTFRLDYPRLFGPLGFRSVHITELLLERDFHPGSLSAAVTFHDPCRLGRHLGIYDPPRRLLEAVPGLELREMPRARAAATCCGGTCWMECGAAVKSMQSARLAEAEATGADRLVTACPKCDIHFACALAAPGCSGPRVTNIVDLLAEAAGLAEPAPEPAPEGR